MAAHVLRELQTLAERLLRKPPMTLAAGQRLVVYGCVHTDEHRPDYATSCADLLAWCSAAECWRLSRIFRDAGVSSDTLVRPGFGGLPHSAGVLQVDSTHPSASAPVATRPTLAVSPTGTTVRILADKLREEGQ